MFSNMVGREELLETALLYAKMTVLVFLCACFLDGLFTLCRL